GHGAVATLERPGTEANGAVDARQQVVPLTTAAKPATDSETAQSTDRAAAERSAPPASSPPRAAEMHSGPDRLVELQASTPRLETPSAPRASAAADESGGTPATGSPETAATPQGMGALKEAFVRQLQLDRLTMRQMRSLLMAEDARRAIEVAAGATEGTYERLALILFGVDLGQLLGKQAPVPANTGITAEERLELQREKARIRARLRRAAIKAAKLNPSA
ncbi:MAG: hypothetical protein JOZ81_32555, partial [Chloroflexi bacterium]|nr:hypothetical protein [Chloroflexota bacterium]